MFTYCLNNPVILIDPDGFCSYYSNLSGWFCKGECSVEYEVDAYSQGDTSICWAYCQVMIFAFRNDLDLSQEEATEQAKKLAQEVNGFLFWDHGAWPTNKGRAFQINNIAELRDILEKFGPVYAHYANTDASKGKRYSHLVIVTGVDMRTNTVYTNNPWNNTTTSQTFEEFLEGVAYDSPNAYGMTLQKVYLPKY